MKLMWELSTCLDQLGINLWVKGLLPMLVQVWVELCVPAGVPVPLPTTTTRAL